MSDVSVENAIGHLLEGLSDADASFVNIINDPVHEHALFRRGILVTDYLSHDNGPPGVLLSLERLRRPYPRDEYA